MLKTNNKLVKKYFDEYLEFILSEYFNDNIDAMVYQFFCSSSDARNKLCTKYKTYQEAFETISFNYAECYYDDMRNTLKEALQETEEEANKYNNDKVAEKYNYLLYSAYLRKCEKEKINPFKYFK